MEYASSATPTTISESRRYSAAISRTKTPAPHVHPTSSHTREYMHLTIPSKFEIYQLSTPSTIPKFQAPPTHRPITQNHMPTIKSPHNLHVAYIPRNPRTIKPPPYAHAHIPRKQLIPIPKHTPPCSPNPINIKGLSISKATQIQDKNRWIPESCLLQSTVVWASTTEVMGYRPLQGLQSY